LITKIITIGAIVLLSACAEMQTAEQPINEKAIATKASNSKDATAKTDATTAIAAAEKARKAAHKVGYEWRDTAKLIKQAKKAVKKKKYTKAIKLAKKAERQGNDAVAQYHDQKNAAAMN